MRKSIFVFFVFFVVLNLFALAACGAEPAAALYDYEIADIPITTPAPTTQPPTEPPTEPETEPEPDPIHIRLQFAGDILLHGGLGAGTGPGTFDYRPFMWAIRPYINADLALVNMETPVDVFGDNRDIRTWPRFNAPFEILEGLIYAGFNHLITANNHSFDMGFSGLQASLANFERAGIAQTGMYTNEEDFNAPSIVDIEGIQVGIIAYTDSVNGLESLVPDDIRPFAVRRFRSHVMYDVPYMAADIAQIREAGADLVVISLHWGAEYVDAPNNMQRQIARALVDAGADIIMGHHSHTPQPLEWHEREDGTRGLIIYSLGNFLSDQIALNIPATQYGMLVTAYVKMSPQGEIYVYDANALATVFVRDPGRTLGAPYSILPVINGEVPDSVENEHLRAWGRRAHAHVLRIVGEEFIK
ncbi:MAG: CapA family protein [Clostridiales bacterium]|jgi:poly-gamma-glutamate synthesis protein (capsule biosynthesis protein)|nr:CapA family protein [Clostridiales bacterium]